ncbi:hypothetical protein JCM6882_007593 [Rhodosporidiobolus microsporus]
MLSRNRITLLSTDVSTHLAPAYSRIDNYVGILNEWCQKYPSRRETFETYTAVGPPHIRVFSCSTTVTGVSAEGEGTFVGQGMTKKEAKSKAAYEACIALGLI